MASWTNLPQFQVTTATSIARMDQLLENIIVSSSHAHTGSPQGGSVLGIYTLGTNAMQVAPGYGQLVHPFLPACLSNWDRVVACPGYRNGGIMKTTAGVSASGACIAYPIMLYTNLSPRVYITGYGDTNSGCVAACIGGSQLLIGSASTQSLYSATAKEIDLYYAALGANVSSGLVTVRLQVVGKDAASGGYHAGLTHIVVAIT